jgi:hypothetical protein
LKYGSDGGVAGGAGFGAAGRAGGRCGSGGGPAGGPAGETPSIVAFDEVRGTVSGAGAFATAAGAAGAGAGFAAAWAAPSAEGATPIIVRESAPEGAAAAGVGAEGAGVGAPPSTGLGPVRRASSGCSTWNDVPHLGQRIFRPDAGTLRSSTWYGAWHPGHSTLNIG